MFQDKSVTNCLGYNLAELLADKIIKVYGKFDKSSYISRIKNESKDLSYTKRIELHAVVLNDFLPKPFPVAVKILISILGNENPKETGMFKNFYWILPIAKFVEMYGLDFFYISMSVIAEITKRSTGEYAIRSFIRKYPKKTIKIMQKWSKSNNFHLRRLASEGCRPKLPWSSKLNEFINDPKPVFLILENLMKDDVKFVQKSVANNLTDYLKVNKKAAIDFIDQYIDSQNIHTHWIIKRATKKISIYN